MKGEELEKKSSMSDLRKVGLIFRNKMKDEEQESGSPLRKFHGCAWGQWTGGPREKGKINE